MGLSYHGTVQEESSRTGKPSQLQGTFCLFCQKCPGASVPGSYLRKCASQLAIPDRAVLDLPSPDESRSHSQDTVEVKSQISWVASSKKLQNAFNLGSHLSKRR